MYQPLADKIRPLELDDMVGQQHIIGPDGLLRRILESGQIPNMIFYGPSGVGKTTLAQIIANKTDRRLVKLNATTASTADIKGVVSELDTLLAPFVIPLTLRVLLGSVVEMDTASMVGNLMIMVAIPALLAMTLFRMTRGRVAATVKPRLAPFAKLTMLVLVLANATGCAPFLRDITPTLVKLICAVFALCLLGFFLGYQAARLLKADFPTAVTMSLNSGIRNIAAGSVLAIAYFPGDVLFPVAFSPLFLQATTAVIVKILHATKTGKAFLQQGELSK